jgi:hypothetical protein
MVEGQAYRVSRTPSSRCTTPQTPVTPSTVPFSTTIMKSNSMDKHDTHNEYDHTYISIWETIENELKSLNDPMKEIDLLKQYLRQADMKLKHQHTVIRQQNDKIESLEDCIQQSLEMSKVNKQHIVELVESSILPLTGINGIRKLCGRPNIKTNDASVNEDAMTAEMGVTFLDNVAETVMSDVTIDSDMNSYATIPLVFGKENVYIDPSNDDTKKDPLVKSGPKCENNIEPNPSLYSDGGKQIYRFKISQFQNSKLTGVTCFINYP